MTSSQREQLRHAVLAFLAERPRLAYSAQQVAMRLRQDRRLDGRIDDQDVSDAFEILAGKSLAKLVADPLGSTQYAQATADGVLAWERGMAAQEG